MISFETVVAAIMAVYLFSVFLLFLNFHFKGKKKDPKTKKRSPGQTWPPEEEFE